MPAISVHKSEHDVGLSSCGIGKRSLQPHLEKIRGFMGRVGSEERIAIS